MRSRGNLVKLSLIVNTWGNMRRRDAAGGPSGGSTERLGPELGNAPTAPGSTGYSAEEFDRVKRERDEALKHVAALALLDAPPTWRRGMRHLQLSHGTSHAEGVSCIGDLMREPFPDH